MSDTRVSLPWPLVAAAAVALVAVSAFGTYVWIRKAAVPIASEARTQQSQPQAMPDASSTDDAVTISPDVVKRAQLEIVTVTTSAASSTVHIPATVAPNADQQVVAPPR